jgi:hypothetical protein
VKRGPQFGDQAILRIHQGTEHKSGGRSECLRCTERVQMLGIRCPAFLA